MLDSSPVALPAVHRPLKRSASTASLPTPPRTHYRQSRSRGSQQSDSDVDPVLSSDDEVPENNKKRRTGDVKVQDEEAFWLTGEGSTVGRGKLFSATKASGKARFAADPTPLLCRRQHMAKTITPMSPPLSNRKTTTVAKLDRGSGKDALPIVEPGPGPSPPTTPKNRRSLRDSPENPFLASPSDDSESGTSPHGPITPFAEKPTVTYVFRGVRRVYQNPLYNHAENRPLSPPPNSKLSVEDPDFSPSSHCTPKFLFPSHHTRNAVARRKAASVLKPAVPSKSHSRRSLSPCEDEAYDSEDDFADLKPIKLAFTADIPSLTKAGGSKGQNIGVKALSWKDELKKAGEHLSL